MEDRNEVWLSDIKISGLKPAKAYTTNETNASKLFGHTQSSSAPSKGYQADPSFLAGNRRAADERLARDKLGEELAPSATIWELYQEEANEFDGETVDGRNKNLDTMLIFAGLFSAIVTGFLIESKNMLQQDRGEASLRLLLYIAQSQQRLEEGVARPTSPLVTIPPFEALASARWLNGLWFMSLTLSLCAALIAMLAKEWLTAFVTSRPRSPYEHALLHQERLRGMDRWHALHIIDFLPTLMHFSLLLFSIGLVIQLATLDLTIAVSVVIIVGVTVCFYIATIVLTSLVDFCPFITQVSKYTQAFFTPNRTLATLLKRMVSESDANGITSRRDLQALSWLSAHARDTTVSDCSYQALAGIKMPHPADKDPKPEPPTNMSDQLGKTIVETPGSSYRLVAEMFQTVCTRIPHILASKNDLLPKSQENSVARYSIALPGLAQFMAMNIPGPMFWDNEKQEDWAHLWMHEAPIQAAFGVFDYLWNDERPHFTADTFALLTASELRLVAFAASHHYWERLSLTEDMMSPPQNNSFDPDHLTKSWSAVDITNDRMRKVRLFDLRSRFSRALFRAGVQLYIRSEGCVSISNNTLIYLLESIRLGFSCPDLNPTTPTSTHQQQHADKAALPVFHVDVTGTGTARYLPPLDIDDVDGLLTNIMRALCSAASARSSELVKSASHTLCVVAPVLLRQRLNMSLNSEAYGPEEKSRITLHLEDPYIFWQGAPESNDDAYALGIWTLGQLLRIAFVSVSFSEHSGIKLLAGRALHTLRHLTDEIAGQQSALEVASQSGRLISGLIQALCVGADPHALRCLIQWLLITGSLGTHTIIQYSRGFNLSQDVYHIFFQIWVQRPELDSELKHLVDRMLNGPMKDAIDFLWTEAGLIQLVEIGRHPKYAPTLSDLLVQMIRLAMENDPDLGEDLQRRPQMLPDFLRAIDCALNYMSDPVSQYPTLSMAFFLAASNLLSRVRRLPINHGGSEPIEMQSVELVHNLLKTEVIAKSPERNELLAEYDDLSLMFTDVDAWTYAPFTRLFGEPTYSQLDPIKTPPVAPEGITSRTRSSSVQSI